VFLPVALMPGISGQFFKNFGATVAVSVLISLAVARLITPMLAAFFLKSEGQSEHGTGKWVDTYMGILNWALANRMKTVFGIGGVALGLTIALFTTLPMTFQPSVDNDDSQVTIALPPGVTLAQTESIVEKAVAVVESSPDLALAFADVDVGGGNIYLTLKKDRSMHRIDWERAMAPKLAAIPDARIGFANQDGGGPGGSREINITLTGNDPLLLDRAAQQVVTEMRAMPELRQARIDGGLQRPEITIKPRLDLAAELGVTTAALSETIRIATLGDIDQNVAKFSVADRQIPIRVALAASARRNLSTIENLPVPTNRGGTVPLKVVAEISFGAGPTEIRRFNQQRRIQMGADLAPGLLSGDVQLKVNQLPSLKNLPPGIETVQLGMQKWLGELVSNFILAVIAGVVMVFAVLVLLYKRVLPPFVNMMSLLLAPLGGLIALAITGNAISMPVFIGLLMLLGIVAKNSILLVDMAIEEMEKGVPKLEAILEAGHKRVQPIIMTTVAMVAGMMPVALALGGDGSWRAPMGIVVIGGLIVSTALTLIIVPAGFSIAVSVEEWLAPRMKRWFTNNEGAAKLPGATPAE
jgi:multidrug efflux pump subunit AcrB